MAESFMPPVYLAHGGGPLPVLGHPTQNALAQSMRGLADHLPAKPDAILVVSAHWEERRPTVTTGGQPDLIYDYYGFPPESYELKYPAKGSPALAQRVVDLLKGAGFADVGVDEERGFDHGVFIPLLLAFPKADIPVVQLSLMHDLSPAKHLAVGRALAPLTASNVLVVGSGLSFHNLRALMPTLSGSPASSELVSKSKAFDAWLSGVCTAGEEERDKGLEQWEQAPHARYSHPREEHLLPLMVAAGAAGTHRAAHMFKGDMGGAAVSSFVFSK